MEQLLACKMTNYFCCLGTSYYATCVPSRTIVYTNMAAMMKFVTKK